jgi:hypothetical protein
MRKGLYFRNARISTGTGEILIRAGANPQVFRSRNARDMTPFDRR